MGQSRGLAGGLRCPLTGPPGREAGSLPHGGYRRGSEGRVQSADLFCLAHTVFWKKKKKSPVSCPHLKLRRVPPQKSDFHFLIIITKANISVSLTACGALPNGSRLSAPPDWESSVLGRFCAAGVRLAVSRLLQLGQPRRWPRLLLVVCVPAWQPWARAGGGLGTRPPLTSASPALCMRVPPLPGPRLGVHWTWTVLSVERSGWVRGGTLLISALSHSSLAHPSRP